MRLAEWLIERPRWLKRALLVFNDFALLSFAIWAAYTLRLSRPYIPESTEMLLLMAAAPVIGVLTFFARGLYRLVTRFIGPEGSTRIYIAVFIASALWALAVLMSGIQGNPRSVVVIYALVAAGLIRLSRQWAASFLTKVLPRQAVVSSEERKPVIIYGAGTVGIQLLRALNDTGQYDTVAFVDDTPTLAGQVVHGVRCFSPGRSARRSPTMASRK
jgi:FlaA1/EpsC-like NDP-sugar epimerase